jgi:hypothetical protein
MSSATFVGESDTRKLTNQYDVVNRYYFGDRDATNAGPQSWLIEYPADRKVRSHFHQIDQFQVFFTQPGTIYQRHEMESLVVHYADAYSTYGPIVTGAQPIKFMTLRAQGSSFVAFMPEGRDALIKRGLRNFHVGLASWLEDPVPPPGEVATQSLFKAQKDGLAAFTVSAGSGATVIGPSPEGSSGQYYCVVSGNARSGDRELLPFSVGWCDENDDPPVLVAGEYGARWLVLQFPSPATASKP